MKPSKKPVFFKNERATPRFPSHRAGREMNPSLGLLSLPQMKDNINYV
jgi:hypothetical protein